MRIHLEDVGKELHLFSIIVVFGVQLSKFQNYHYTRMGWIPDSLGKQIFRSTVKSHFCYAYVFHHMCLSKTRFQERSKLILFYLVFQSMPQSEHVTGGNTLLSPQFLMYLS